MRLIGHRANTARWLKRQLKCSHGVEIDVVVDKDGVLRSGHMAPAGRPLLLRERLARVLGELRFTPSPRLEELLAGLSPGQLLLLDLKTRVDVEKLVEAVRAAGLEPRDVIVSTRWHNDAPLFSSLGFSVLLSIDSRPADPVGLVEAAKGHGIAVRYSYLDEKLVGSLHGAGLVVAAWTINEPETLCRARGLGVDLVVTDIPCTARQWLRSC